GLFAHKTGILPQPLPSGSSSKYLGKQMNILPDDHRVEYVTTFLDRVENRRDCGECRFYGQRVFLHEI
ncbi:hypothetical protein, partial [Pectobacterium sp. HCp5_1]|uniref:hypothetical protein n=1 Tax=Pectobacterium sp. HCp5_1 TaxID=3062446 RepID=UPI00293BAC1C